MAFRELVRRLLAADVMVGTLLAFSYALIVLTGVEVSQKTYVVMQLGAALIVVNFLLTSAVLYTGWEPV